MKRMKCIKFRPLGTRGYMYYKIDSYAQHVCGTGVVHHYDTGGSIAFENGVRAVI